MKKRRIRYTLIYILAILILNPWYFPALAGDFHEAPYDFFFDNHIDTHLETRLKIKDDIPVRLKGFFYIIFTGEDDPVSGLPIARHPRGAGHNEVCGDNFDDEFDDDLEDEGNDIDCVVGWTVKGKSGMAKFLYHSGINGNDHPVWMVNRTQIKQPGSYTHFHWIGKESTDPRAPEEVPEACDKINASDLEDEAPSAVDMVCPGWFLQIKAVEEFAFDHGGEIVPVRPGIDNATHLNLVTNYAEVSGITTTRPDNDSH